jgi:hypothetical protein
MLFKKPRIADFFTQRGANDVGIDSLGTLGQLFDNEVDLFEIYRELILKDACTYSSQDISVVFEKTSTT